MRRNTPLRLAKTPDHWIEIDDAIAEHVQIVCGRYDDSEQVRAFLTLLDLTTNREYEQSDRETIAFAAERMAFQYAPECYEAQTAYMDKLKVPKREVKTA